MDIFSSNFLLRKNSWSWFHSLIFGEMVESKWFWVATTSILTGHLHFGKPVDGTLAGNIWVRRKFLFQVFFWCYCDLCCCIWNPKMRNSDTTVHCLTNGTYRKKKPRLIVCNKASGKKEMSRSSLLYKLFPGVIINNKFVWQTVFNCP